MCDQAVKIFSERKDMSTAGKKNILDAVEVEETVILNRDVVKENARKI